MENASHRQIQETSKLLQKKYRDRYNRYLISGRHAISAALQAEELRPVELFVTAGALSLLSDLPLPPDLPVFQITEKEAKKISAEVTPQGLVLVAERPGTLPEQTEFQAPLLYLEEINDPGNLGTIIRTACWFGLKQILLSPNSADPYQPKSVRASAGYVSHLSIFENVTRDDLESIKKKTHFKLVGTSVSDGVPLPELTDQTGNELILAFGSEAHGLSDHLLQICDAQMTIPGQGMTESLNLSTAVAIALYQVQIIENKKAGEKNNG